MRHSCRSWLRRFARVFALRPEVESLNIDEALSCDVVGMNNDLMVEYIEFVADRLILVLLLLGISMHVLLQAHWGERGERREEGRGREEEGEGVRGGRGG